jgi:nucleotide-binding universal stress UspA family protein
MYRHILIPTDGSELARRAVQHGLSLAKSVVKSHRIDGGGIVRCLHSSCLEGL